MTTENDSADESPPTQQVYEVMDDDELSLEEKQRRALTIAKEYLGVTNGHIQRHPSNSTTDEILISVGDDPEFLPEGTTIDSDKTYCRKTIQEPSPVAISNALEQGWQDDPAYKEHEFDCYLGTTLFVRGDVYGAVCCVQQTPREEEFTTEETMFIELVARLLGREIEAAQLERRTEEKAALQDELEKTTRGTLQLASELEEKYQNLFETAAEGIYTTTAGLEEYAMANPAFADLLGYENGEELTAAVDSIEEVFVDADQYAAYSETLQAEGELDQFEYQLRTTDGEIRWVSDSVTALTDEEGTIEGYQGGVIDITEKKQQERDLKRQKNLGIVLNRVLRHNLRNDLSVVRGFAQMMIDDLGGDHEGQRAVKTVDDLIELTEKARELDKIVASDADPQPTDIPNVINGVITGLRDEYPSASISVAAAEEITADVLPSFKRAVQELIENAVEHSGDSPTVEVTVEAGENGVEVRIIDDGPGLNEQEIGVLQSGTETALMHGSGLGLWLTHWIVSKNGGSIDVTGTTGGTTLTIKLPPATPSGNQQQLIDITRARDQYRAAFEESGDAMTITGDDARILDVNNEACRIYGMDRQELLGRSIREFLPDDFDFEAEWAEMVAGESKRGEVPAISADGVATPVSYTAKSHIVPGQHLIVSRDITERKEREQRLQLAETVFQNIKDALVLVDVVDEQEYQLNRVNDAFLAFTPHNRADITGMTPKEMLGDKVGGEIQSQFEECVSSQQRVEFEQVVPGSEETRIWEVRLTPLVQDGEVTQLVTVMRNITERKERERILRTRTRAIDNAPVGITITDPSKQDNPMSYANKAFRELTGYDHDEILDYNCRFLQGDNTDPEKVAKIRTAIDNGESVSTVLRNYRKDGTMFWNHLSIAPVTDADGEITNWVGFQEDITERVEREQQLIDTETIFENTQDALFMIEVTENQEFQIQRVNAAYEKLTGLSNEEVQGKSPREVVGDDIGSKIEAQYRECVERRETIKYPEEIPVDGELRHWQTKLTPVVKDGIVVRLIGAMRDVTEQKQN